MCTQIGRQPLSRIRQATPSQMNLASARSSRVGALERDRTARLCIPFEQLYNVHANSDLRRPKIAREVLCGVQCVEKTTKLPFQIHSKS